MPWRHLLNEEDETHRSEYEPLIRKRARVIVLQRAVVAFVFIFSILALSILVLSSIQGYYARQELLDCTRPTGKCYSDAQKRTGAIVGQIVNQTVEGAVPLHKRTRQIAILAAFCADQEGDQTHREIQKCVIDALEGR